MALILNDATVTMLETSENACVVTIRLRPNRSATWAQTKLLMGSFTIFVSSIATAWAFAGAWVILPFAGAEVLALLLIMYVVSLATYRWQSIELTDKKIKIENSKSITITFIRELTHLYYYEDVSRGRLPRLVFKTASHMYEVGDFLNEADKKRLLKTLQRYGIIVCKSKWW